MALAKPMSAMSLNKYRDTRRAIDSQRRHPRINAQHGVAGSRKARTALDHAGLIA